mgnify:CR=1 FL=1
MRTASIAASKQSAGERGAMIAQIASSRGKISETELQILNLDQEMRTEVARDLREVVIVAASGMADAGLAVETPAKRFKLDFVPLVTERYFLLANQSDLDSPAIRAVLDILGSDAAI